MAAVLLAILKTVGIILLIIVLAVIALLACVMLIPVQYGASGDIESGRYHIRVTWLFRILQFRLDIEDKDISPGIWIFWRKTGLLDSDRGGQRSRRKERRQARKQQRQQKKYEKEREKLKKKTDFPQREKSETEVKVRIEEKKPESEQKESVRTETMNSGKKGKRIRPDLTGISQTVRKITGILKEANNKNIPGIVLPALRDMLYHIRPRRMEGNLIFGFRDPSATGKVLGMASWVFFLYQFEDFILTPDFETDQTYIKGNFHVSGHFRLIHLPVFAFRMIRRKEFRAFLKSLRHSK